VFDGKDTFYVPIPDSAPPTINDLMNALHPRMQAVLNVAAMTEAEVREKMTGASRIAQTIHCVAA
jgi:hypothetical protein